MKKLLILALVLVLVILALGQTPVRLKAWPLDENNFVYALRPIGNTEDLDIRASEIDMRSALSGTVTANRGGAARAGRRKNG